jgi:hypothetical protein
VATFEQLVAEAQAATFSGWDFSWLAARSHISDDFYRLLGLPVPDQPGSWFPLAQRQLRDAGLTVRQAMAGEELERFNDVAAIIYYLRAVSWAVPEFTLDRFEGRLRELHATPGAWPVVIRQPRFLVIATKDVTSG